MAFQGVRHLHKRGDWFYLRLVFPLSLHPIVRRVEVWTSLKTKDFAEASTGAALGVLAFRRLCDTIRAMQVLTDDDVRVLIQDFHAERFAQAEQPAAHPETEGRDWNKHLAEEMVGGLEEVIAADDYDASNNGTPRGDAAGTVRTFVTALYRAKDIDVGTLPGGRRAALEQGVARALLDEHRLFLHQLSDRLTSYQSPDPFFAAPRVAAPATPQPDTDTSAAAPRCIALGKAIDAYIATKVGVSWTPRTEVEFRRVFRWVREKFGAKTPLSAITKKQVRDFRDDIVRVRRYSPTNAAFKTILTDDAARQVDRKTAAKHFQALASAFKWWVAEGYIEQSPVAGLTVVIPKSAKAKARTPFKPDELTRLFTSPIYTGCAGPKQRTVPGPHIIRDGYYWVPLVGALSGMRLGEIVQLGADDIDTDGEIPAMTVRASEETGGTVKSDAGWRAVPIHRRLIELGFLEFVRERQKKGGRIFADIPYAFDGFPSHEYSRWFGRRLKALGLKRPGLVFHSFRHSFVDALREVNTPGYVLKAIIGHEQSSVTDGYGQGASLSLKREWVDRVGLLDGLPPS